MLCEHVTTGEQQEQFGACGDWYQVLYAPLGEYQQHGTTKTTNAMARTITYEAEDMPIADAREIANQRRRDRRYAAEIGGYLVLGGDAQHHRVDTDETSIHRMDQATFAAMANPDFVTEWVCADEYHLSLDAAGMIGLKMQFVIHGGACHARSEEIKAAIDAAQTVAEIAAIDMEAGWPG